MRILQVSTYFHPYVGGQERYVRSLAKALADLGHTVEVLTSDFPKGKGPEVIDGIKVTRCKFLFKPLNNPIQPALFFRLMQKNRNFDVIHAHNEHAFASQCCSWVKSYSKVPLVITCHGLLRFDESVKDFVERAYSRTFGSKVLSKANMVMAISDSDKKYISSLGVSGEKIKVVPNAVDLTSYDTNQENLQNKMAFDGKQVVLFVGPLLKRKGPQVLIHAIPSIIREDSNVVFVFAGAGSFKEEAEKLSRMLHVEKHTYFTGYIPENRLYSLYQQSDVFVLPSFSEALSYTILDAFVFSKPVVSTLIPCISDYLRESALLVPPGDSKALAYATLRILRDQKLARELGARGRRLVETRFRWDKVVNEVLNTYCEVLNEPTP